MRKTNWEDNSLLLLSPGGSLDGVALGKLIEPSEDLREIRYAIVQNGRVIEREVRSLGATQVVLQGSVGAVEGDVSTLQGDVVSLDSRVDALEQGGGVPVGGIIFVAGSTAPSGFLLCNGGFHNKASFPALDAYLANDGYPYGSNGTQFGVPDGRGRAFVMLDGAANRLTSASVGGGNAGSLGGSGGAQTHTLVVTQMPVHNHPYDDVFLAGSAQFAQAGSSFSTVAAPPLGHAKGTSNAGSGQAHSNTQPWIALNAAIRT